MRHSPDSSRDAGSRGVSCAQAAPAGADYTVVKRLLLSALLLLGTCGPTLADTMNPNVVTFIPSANHHSIGAGGRPMVTGYALHIHRLGATAAETVVDLGKPAPDADGYIRVNLGSRLAGLTSAGVPFEGRIVAIGPGGVSSSSASNLFHVDSCRFVVAGSTSVAGAGGPVSVAVVTRDGCQWRAETGTSWLSYTAESSGIGPGRLGVTAAANPTREGRLGAVSIGSELVFVFQGPGA
jgi:hypothetical protein